MLIAPGQGEQHVDGMGEVNSWTVYQWIQIVEEIYLMEKLTHDARLQKVWTALKRVIQHRVLNGNDNELLNMYSMYPFCIIA